jgi:hypothetical protein
MVRSMGVESEGWERLDVSDRSKVAQQPINMRNPYVGNGEHTGRPPLVRPCSARFGVSGTGFWVHFVGRIADFGRNALSTASCVST